MLILNCLFVKMLPIMEIFVHKKGQQQGPYNIEQLQESVSNGAFSTDDLCWHSGLEGWHPISSILPEISPLSGSAPNLETKTEPLSIWSLVLGILSWLCFSILAGIPAIICGHLSLRRLKKNTSLRGKSMAIAGLVLGYISSIISVVAVTASLLLPLLSGSLERAQSEQKLNNARQIQLVIQTIALDSKATGETNSGWPADAGCRSVTDVINMAVQNNYVTADDAEKLFNDLIIGNVSESDPPETILVKSKPSPGKPVVVFRKGGDGFILRNDEADSGGMDPPRSPPYLQ